MRPAAPSLAPTRTTPDPGRGSRVIRRTSTPGERRTVTIKATSWACGSRSPLDDGDGDAARVDGDRGRQRPATDDADVEADVEADVDAEWSGRSTPVDSGGEATTDRRNWGRIGPAPGKPTVAFIRRAGLHLQTMTNQQLAVLLKTNDQFAAIGDAMHGVLEHHRRQFAAISDAMHRVREHHRSQFAAISDAMHRVREHHRSQFAAVADAIRKMGERYAATAATRAQRAAGVIHMPYLPRDVPRTWESHPPPEAEDSTSPHRRIGFAQWS